MNLEELVAAGGRVARRGTSLAPRSRFLKQLPYVETTLRREEGPGRRSEGSGVRAGGGSERGKRSLPQRVQAGVVKTDSALAAELGSSGSPTARLAERSRTTNASNPNPAAEPGHTYGAGGPQPGARCRRAPTPPSSGRGVLSRR